MSFKIEQTDVNTFKGTDTDHGLTITKTMVIASKSYLVIWWPEQKSMKAALSKPALWKEDGTEQYRNITQTQARRLGSEELSASRLHFWDARPYSRIVEWGRAYRNMCSYLDKNRLQAVGFDLTFLAKHLEATKSNTS